MSRVEKILIALINGTSYDGPLLSRVEEILYSFLVDSTYDKPGESRVEDLLLALKNSSLYSDSVISRIEEILYCKLGNVEYTGPIGSRVEALLVQWELTKIITITGVPPFTFNAKGTPLLDYTIYGNTIQSGTPTPDNPIEPEFVGDLVSIELDEPLRAVGDYKDTLDLATKTYTKRIQELVLTGEENWTFYSRAFYTNKNFNNDYLISPTDVVTMSSQYRGKGGVDSVYDFDSGDNIYEIAFCNNTDRRLFIRYVGLQDVQDFKSYLAQQYTNNTPVKVWYVLAEPIVTTLSSIPDGLTGVIEGTVTQSGTPTPDNPIEPVFKGDLQLNGKYQVYKTYKIPISSGGQTKTIYLGQVQTTRRIKKLVLTGEENFTKYAIGKQWSWTLSIRAITADFNDYTCLANTYIGIGSNGYGSVGSAPDKSVFTRVTYGDVLYIMDMRFTEVADFKSYLAQQYAAGTPVTVWYVLATPEVGIVNEPLAKIGDYADSVNFEQAGVEIPVIAGENTLSVGTTVQPSNMSIEVEEGYVPKKPVYITSDDKLYITSNDEVYILRR